MFKYITIALVLTVSLLGLFPQRLVSQELKISELPVAMQVNHFAKIYGVDGSIVNKVIKCESEGFHGAVGDGGRSRGIAQFQKSTFERMEKKLGEDLNYESSYDQIKLLTYAISQGWGNEWTAYVAIKKGGKYSFYSKQLKKHFVVYCK